MWDIGIMEESNQKILQNGESNLGKVKYYTLDYPQDSWTKPGT